MSRYTINFDDNDKLVMNIKQWNKETKEFIHSMKSMYGANINIPKTNKKLHFIIIFSIAIVTSCIAAQSYDCSWFYKIVKAIEVDVFAFSALYLLLVYLFYRFQQQYRIVFLC